MSNRRLLIAEDSELTASALRLLFEESGFDVAVATSVQSVIDIATSWKPDVMLLDVNLSDGDGVSALDYLTQNDSAPPRTIALTGHDDDDVRQRCINAGCSDVLLKPAPIARLLELARSP